ncbi:MAG TPA: GNAT family N-acetyltransferase [Bryobacteraceae bacterium]
MDDSIQIGVWDNLDGDLAALGALLHTCVCAGSSVGFVLPFSHEEAVGFWRDQVWPSVAAGTRRVLLARSGAGVAGTVQLDFSTPPNQPHRAEVRKLLVHPDARRRGIAVALMGAVEAEAREAGRTLLTLDTVKDGPAEALYRSLGYQTVGSIPGYALNFDSSKFESAIFMYKIL